MTEFLETAEGTLAYQVTGDGPLVVCSPGMGDLRSTFDNITPALVEAGYRVAAMDIRGLGESSAGWRRYGDSATATDILALAKHLSDRPAILFGNSCSAGAAVIAARQDPAAVAALVLTGPFALTRSISLVDKATAAVFGIPGIGRMGWLAYWPKFFGTKPADFEARRLELKRNLAESGRFAAVHAIFYEDHSEADDALVGVHNPALIVMGDADPDFADPVDQAKRIAARHPGPNQVVIVPGAGHYPHSERVDLVAPAVVEFLNSLDRTPCPE